MRNNSQVTLSHVITILDVLDEYITQEECNEISKHGWDYIQAMLYIINNQLKEIRDDIETIKKDE